MLDLAMEAELAVDAEKSFNPSPPPESCVYAQWAYKPRKMAPPKVKVAPVETKLAPSPPPQKTPTVEATMDRFAKMILDGMQRIQSTPVPPPAPLSPRNRSGEKRKARRKSSSKRADRRTSRQVEKTNSSSDSSEEERAKRSPGRTDDTSAPAPGAFSCYGCGAPGVIPQNCLKCAGNAPQPK